MSFEHCDRFHSSMGQHYRVYYADPLGLRREAGRPREENGLPPTLRRRLRRLFATLDFRNAPADMLVPLALLEPAPGGAVDAPWDGFMDELPHLVAILHLASRSDATWVATHMQRLQATAWRIAESALAWMSKRRANFATVSGRNLPRVQNPLTSFSLRFAVALPWLWQYLSGDETPIPHTMYQPLPTFTGPPPPPPDAGAAADSGPQQRRQKQKRPNRNWRRGG